MAYVAKLRRLAVALLFLEPRLRIGRLSCVALKRFSLWKLRSLGALVRQRRAGEVALDHLQILAEPIELAQMPLDREPLVFRHDLLDEPSPALRAARREGRKE